MPFFAFRNNRNGKVTTIFASNVIEAVNAATIYPWAFTLIDVRDVSKSPVTDKTPSSEFSVPPFMSVNFRKYAEEQRFRHIESFNERGGE